MLKEFELSITAEMVEADPSDSVGTYVEAREAKKLYKLNKEMLEVLKEAHNEILAMHIIYEGRDGSGNPLLQQIKSTIAKTEEV